MKERMKYEDEITYRIDDNGPGNFEIVRHISRLGFPGMQDVVAECYTKEDADIIVKALSSYKGVR